MHSLQMTQHAHCGETSLDTINDSLLFKYLGVLLDKLGLPGAFSHRVFRSSVADLRLHVVLVTFSEGIGLLTQILLDKSVSLVQVVHFTVRELSRSGIVFLLRVHQIVLGLGDVLHLVRISKLIKSLLNAGKLQVVFLFVLTHKIDSVLKQFSDFGVLIHNLVHLVLVRSLTMLHRVGRK